MAPFELCPKKKKKHKDAEDFKTCYSQVKKNGHYPQELLICRHLDESCILQRQSFHHVENFHFECPDIVFLTLLPYQDRGPSHRLCSNLHHIAMVYQNNEHHREQLLAWTNHIYNNFAPCHRDMEIQCMDSVPAYFWLQVKIFDDFNLCEM